MNYINFFSKGLSSLNTEQKILQKLLYFNVSKYIQELMLLGFEYSFQLPVVLNLESTKGYFYTAPLFRYNELIKLNYLIKDFSSIKKNKIKGFNSYLYFLTLLTSFKTTNPFSSTLHIMSNTGAKANWNQICQLIGVRGYLANSKGVTFKLPILNSFNVGLNLYEYFISCYGARKGILDTAIKTADAGYLTRRLVESAQEVVIKEFNCGTQNYIKYNTTLDFKGNSTYPLFLFLYGKSLTHNIINTSTKKVLEFKNKYITNTLLNKLKKSIKNNYITFNTTSIKTCLLDRSFCSTCFGFSTFHSNFLGKSVGIIAGQSVGEPGTQLTLRTFHMGGTSSTYKVDNKKYTTIFNSINKINLIKKFFKICLISNFKYKTNYCKYLSFIIYIKCLKHNIFYTISKHTSIYLVLSYIKLIYYTNINSILNKMLLTSNIVYNIFQRKQNTSHSIGLNYTGEFLLKNSVNLLIKNTLDNWIILNLNKTLVFKNYFNLFILSSLDTLKYKVSKNNRNLKIHILRKHLISSFSHILLRNYLNTFYLIYLYVLFFSLNNYQLVEKKINNINTYNKNLFKFNIIKLKNNKISNE